MEQEFKTGRCPQCGEELKVPTNLARFSCMYCGARLTQEELRPLHEQVVLGEGAAEDYDLALSRLADCVLKFRGWQSRISGKEFEPAFEDYSNRCAPVFTQLDSGVRAAESGRNQLIEKAADRMLADLEESWNKEKRSNYVRDDDKIIIAVYLVPMVRKLQLSISEPFVETLQKKWVAKYPKSPFYLGSYEDIAEGFKKKFLGLCFITTAVCESEGKSDDCEELTAFRAFRDGWLKEQSDGADLICEYYNIAPGIVTCIDLCSDRASRYAAIREQYLQPCFDSLQAGDMESCKAKYVQMVRDLEKEYLS